MNIGDIRERPTPVPDARFLDAPRDWNSAERDGDYLSGIVNVAREKKSFPDKKSEGRKGVEVWERMVLCYAALFTPVTSVQTWNRQWNVAGYSPALRRCLRGWRMTGDGTKGREKALCMTRGFEFPHFRARADASVDANFRLDCSVVCAAVCSRMLHAWQAVAFRCSITLEFISHDHSRHVAHPLSNFPKNRFAAFLFRWLCTRISSTLPC